MIEQIKFPDHYNYSDRELENLIKKTKKNGITLLTTEKDFMRINKKYRADISYLKIKVEIENQSDFIKQIINLYETN